MDKKKVLFMGVGQGGNRSIDEVLKLDKRYTGLFVNTSVKDISLTDNANLDTNVYLIPNADGTGKDRLKAKKYGASHYVSIVDMVKSYYLQTVVYITFTTGGGTGSGLAPMIAKTLRNVFPELTINLVAFKSSKNESKQVLQNTKECLEEIIKIKSFVNNIYIVDNDSRDTVEEVNKEWAKSIDDFLSLSSGSGNNIVDNSDLFNLIHDQGVSHILELDPAFTESVELALKQSIKDSIYIKPVNFDCHYLAISTENEDFDKKRLMDNFFVEIDHFFGGNDYGNFVAFSGGEFPSYLLDSIDEELLYRESKTNEKRRIREERETALLDAIATTPKGKKSEPKPKSKIGVATKSSKDIEDIFADGFFDEFL